MTEDREGEGPKPTEKKPVSEKLFAARRRVQAEVEGAGEAPARTAKRETGEAMRVDWEKVDRTDELLLAQAEELHFQLQQHPDRKDAADLQGKIDVLSAGVGREKRSPEDLEARLYGVGFLLEKNSEQLPGSIREITRRMENPRDYADYMAARRGLEPALRSLARDHGDSKAGEVRNILERRSELHRLTDYLDYTLSGKMSLQEKFSLYLQEGSIFTGLVQKLEKKKMVGGVVRGLRGMYTDAERTYFLRQTVANAFEDAWKWLGFSELRPTTMYSAARLRMERGEADPIVLMAMKVEEERGKVEQGVEERLKAEGVVVEAPTTEEAGTAAAGAGEGVVEEALAQEVAGAEGEAAPAPEGAEGASEEETAEEAEERAAQEEAALPPAEQKALDDLEGLSRAGIVAGSQELIRRVQSGEIQTKTQFMQESARIVGLRLKLRESPEVEKPKVEEPEAREPKKEAEAPQAVRVKEVDTTEEEKRMEQEVDKRVEEEVASGSEWTKGKDFGKARKLVEELAAGTRSLNDLANELYPGKENRDKRVAFKNQFKQRLLAAGIFKEEDVKEKSLTELWRMFTQAVDGVIEEDQRLRNRKEAKKARKKLFVLDALGGTRDYLKAAFMKGISEPGQSG